MKRISYLKRASKRFLDGTKFKSPIAAVEAGVRSLESWVEILVEERENETQMMLEHRSQRQRVRSDQINA
jgi:hypothetical protein